MNTTPEAIMVHNVFLDGTVEGQFILSKHNKKEKNQSTGQKPAGTLKLRPKVAEGNYVENRVSAFVLRVWMLDAFASLFKYWSPENHLTKSLLKFTTIEIQRLLDIIFPIH